MTTAPKLIREQLLALADGWLERECKDKNECVDADGNFRSDTHRAAWNFADGLGTAGSELKRSLADEPVGGEVFTEAAGKALRSIKVGEVLTQEQWDAVCAFIREQDQIIGYHKAAQPDSAEGDAEPPLPWRSINLAPNSDDLIWLMRGDNIDGPRAIQYDDADYYDWFAPCDYPPTALSAAPQPEQYRNLPDGACLQDYLDQLGVGNLTPVDQMALDNKLHNVLTQPEQPARDGVQELYEKWRLIYGPNDGQTRALGRAIASKPPQQVDDTHQFKNFHRSLCARFGYNHDEVFWRRDLVSLEEHIAKLIAQQAEGGADDKLWNQLLMAAERAGFKPDVGETDHSYLQRAIAAKPQQQADGEAVGMVCNDNALAMMFIGTDIEPGTKLYLRPTRGAEADGGAAFREQLSTVIRNLAEIVNAPQTDEQCEKELLPRPYVMERVVRIREAWDQISRLSPTRGVEADGGAVAWCLVDKAGFHVYTSDRTWAKSWAENPEYTAIALYTRPPKSPGVGASIPDGWIVVPQIGTMVKADHPITVLNPSETFEVVAVEIDSLGARARGEDTCWFGVSILAALGGEK